MQRKTAATRQATETEISKLQRGISEAKDSLIDREVELTTNEYQTQILRH